MSYDDDGGAEMAPDLDDVLQVEPDPLAMTPVPVIVTGPARTVELPAQSAGMYTVAAVDTGGARLLVGDPRRKSATVVALDQDVRVGTSQAQAASSHGARWPAAVPLVVTSRGELWAAAVTGTTDVSVIAEQWAE